LAVHVIRRERTEVVGLGVLGDRNRFELAVDIVVGLVVAFFLVEVALVFELVGDVRARAGGDQYGAHGQDDFFAGRGPLAVFAAHLLAKRHGFHVTVLIQFGFLRIEAVGVVNAF